MLTVCRRKDFTRSGDQPPCAARSDMANRDHLLAIMVWQFFDLERSLLDALQERPDELAAP